MKRGSARITPWSQSGVKSLPFPYQYGPAVVPAGCFRLGSVTPHAVRAGTPVAGGDEQRCANNDPEKDGVTVSCLHYLQLYFQPP
jgi:hypothetical protein